MYQTFDYTLIAVIAAAFTILNYIIFYQIINGATKSKQLLQSSNAQLNILIEIALASGVQKDKIAYEINLSKDSFLAQAVSDRYNNKITPDELETIKNKMKAEIV